MKSKITKELVIDLSQIIVGENSYPVWSTGNSYGLNFRLINENNIEIFYRTRQNRLIKRIFPKCIKLTNRFVFLLGLIKGEGANKLGKSNYRRVTFTNTDFKLMQLFIEFMSELKLYDFNNLPDKSIYLHHHSVNDKEAISYWSESLNLPFSKFNCYRMKEGNYPYGVCHIYISNVLLRRVIDLIIDFVAKV